MCRGRSSVHFSPVGSINSMAPNSLGFTSISNGNGVASGSHAVVNGPAPSFACNFGIGLK